MSRWCNRCVGGVVWCGYGLDWMGIVSVPTMCGSAMGDDVDHVSCPTPHVAGICWRARQ